MLGLKEHTLFLLIYKSKLIFLGILVVRMQKLLMSKKILGGFKKHMRSLSGLQGSVSTTDHLNHVPWEHLQIFQLKELTDVRSAHQVTCCFVCQSRKEMQCACIFRRTFLYLFVLKSAGRKLSLNALMFFKEETLLSPTKTHLQHSEWISRSARAIGIPSRYFQCFESKCN